MFYTIDQLPAREIEWLMPGRLALGMLHVLDGDPGQGKSLLTLDLVARLTTGRPWPDGSPACAPAAAVVLNAEDGARNTVRPRLAAAGADLARVTVWEAGAGEPPLRLPHDVDRLDAVLARTAARLLVVDPVLAFLDADVNVGSDPSVRRALAPLADLAARHRCAVLLLRHLRKALALRAMYRGLASIAFTAACRLAWLVGDDPRQPGRHVLAGVKSNVGEPVESLLYTVESTAAGPRLAWHGPCAWSDADLQRALRPHAQLDRARLFLQQALRAGPRPRPEVLAAAREEGLSRETIRRAALALRLESHRPRAFEARICYWRLKDTPIPPHLLTPEDLALAPFFARIEEQEALATGRTVNPGRE